MKYISQALIHSFTIIFFHLYNMNVKNYSLWFMVCDRGLRGPDCKETRVHCCDIIDLYITV